MLSCLYKVLARVLNNRFKLVKDINLSRAQKGFNNSRYIQEVLINLVENIAFCNKENVSGAIVSIDQSKAFDCISQDFLSKAYRFFN